MNTQISKILIVASPDRQEVYNPKWKNLPGVQVQFIAQNRVETVFGQLKPDETKGCVALFDSYPYTVPGSPRVEYDRTAIMASLATMRDKGISAAVIVDTIGDDPVALGEELGMPVFDRSRLEDNFTQHGDLRVAEEHILQAPQHALECCQQLNLYRN